MPISIFSLDWDGCSAVLALDQYLYSSQQEASFDSEEDSWESFYSFQAPQYPDKDYLKEQDRLCFNDWQWIRELQRRKRELELKPLLERFLQRLATGEKTEVFCGSLRQSAWLDNDIICNNPYSSPGSALLHLDEYCTQKGWTMNRFLLADKHLKKEAGFSFDNPSATSSTEISCRLSEKLKEWDPDKTEIITEQLQQIKSKYPDEEINFYFFDDNWETIESLKKYFSKNSKALPEAINLHLIQFLYCGALDNALTPLYRLQTQKSDSVKMEISCKKPEALNHLRDEIISSLTGEQEKRKTIAASHHKQKKELEESKEGGSDVAINKGPIVNAIHPKEKEWQCLSGDTISKVKSIIRSYLAPQTCCSGFFASKQRRLNRALNQQILAKESINLTDIANALNAISHKHPLPRALSEWQDFFRQKGEAQLNYSLSARKE